MIDLEQSRELDKRRDRVSFASAEVFPALVPRCFHLLGVKPPTLVPKAMIQLVECLPRALIVNA